MFKQGNLGEKNKVIKISLILSLLILMIISISIVVWNEKEKTAVSKISINKPREYSTSTTANGLTWAYEVDNCRFAL